MPMQASLWKPALMFRLLETKYILKAAIQMPLNIALRPQILLIKDNITDKSIVSRDGGQAKLSGNQNPVYRSK
jgi:hypothetical protein